MVSKQSIAVGTDNSFPATIPKMRETAQLLNNNALAYKYISKTWLLMAATHTTKAYFALKVVSYNPLFATYMLAVAGDLIQNTARFCCTSTMVKI